MLIFGFVGVGLALAIMVTVRPWFSEVTAAKKHLEGSGGADTLKNHNTILLAIMSAAYGLVIYGIPGHFSFFHANGFGITGWRCGCGNGVVRRWRADVLLRR